MICSSCTFHRARRSSSLLCLRSLLAACSPCSEQQHIGIIMANGGRLAYSNSSSRRCFCWVSSESGTARDTLACLLSLSAGIARASCDNSPLPCLRTPSLQSSDGNFSGYFSCGGSTFWRVDN